MDVEYDSSLADLIAPAPPRPKGFGITVKEFCTNKSCGPSLARRLLLEAVENGILETKSVRIGNGSAQLFFRPGTWPE